MFEVGNKVTVLRGKERGKTAEILAPADPDGQYAVKLDSGQVAVLNGANLKAPAEATIGEAKLAAEIQTALGDIEVTSSAQDILMALVSRLSRDMPGLGARVSWAAEAEIHRAEQRD